MGNDGWMSLICHPGLDVNLMKLRNVFFLFTFHLGNLAPTFSNLESAALGDEDTLGGGGWFIGSRNPNTGIYLLEMGWSNGVLELAGPGRVSLFLSPPDLDHTGGRFVARDPPSWHGLQTSVYPQSYSQTSNVFPQSSKGSSASVSLPGAQLVCWIQTLAFISLGRLSS